MRDKDANSDRTSAPVVRALQRGGREKQCQPVTGRNASTTLEQQMVQWVKYSAYGVPFALPAGDTDSDGDCDGDDITQIDAWIAGGLYDVRGDLNHDGVVDSTDKSLAQNNFQGITLGWNTLSTTNDGLRHAYAGYQWDQALTGLFHVRHRVYVPEHGRWTRRDPLGYIDGMNFYEYVAGRAIIDSDPTGRLSQSSSIGRISIRCYRIPGTAIGAHCAVYDKDNDRICGAGPDGAFPVICIKGYCDPYDESPEKRVEDRCDDALCYATSPIICPSDEAADALMACLEDYMRRVNDNCIGYNAISGPNSNTTIRKALTCCLEASGCSIPFTKGGGRPRTPGNTRPISWGSREGFDLLSDCLPM